MFIPLAASAALSGGASLPALERPATQNMGLTGGDLSGDPFTVGQFVTIIALNSTSANATLTAPASGTATIYNDDNGTRAGNLWTIASLASATATITYSVSRTRSRVIGWNNAQTGIIDWNVTYGTTPLTPAALDVSGKPRAMIYSMILGGTSSAFTAPSNLVNDGGFDGPNGWRRAGTTSAVGATSSFQIANWTSSDNTQQCVCISFAVE